MKKKVFTALGLMSGTSMDGVDLSLIKTDGHSQFHSILDNYYEFDEKLRFKIVKLREKINILEDLNINIEEINTLEREFTLFHANIINDILINFGDEIDLIGFHGQTIFHNPEVKISKQIGDGNLLSQLTKKIIINNFRDEDLINGGQGAPLTPIFHKLISEIIIKKDQISLPINIINIGGITNVTQVHFDKNEKISISFASDIGPGNCLIDEWIRKNSKKKFDKNGEIAKSGKVNELILNQAVDNFSSDLIGKSLDIKDFDVSFVKGLTLEDGCSTLTEFTAHLIAMGIQSFNKKNNIFPINNILCGGGRKNDFLKTKIKKNLKIDNSNFLNIDEYGLKGDFIESQCFGYLSVRSFLRLPISFPNTTGCEKPISGGTLNKNF